ncbi:MAG: ATP-binding protein, partial [Anaeroplasmataceae bacterium]
MKKKLIVINSLILLIALLIFWVTFSISLEKSSTQQATKEMKSFLSLTSSLYDGTNNEYIIKHFKESKSDVRITIIDFDGNVINDSIDIELDNHLDREEIKNLGKVVKRHSNSLNKDMLYYAIRDDINQVYLRVSIYSNDIGNIISGYLLSMFLVLIIILLLSIAVMFPLNKSILYPLNQAIKKLENISGSSNFMDSDSLSELSYQVDNVSKIIKKQIDELVYEKNKLDVIINSINNPLVVIDNTKKISLINKKATEVFGVKLDTILRSNYLFLSRNTNVQKFINNCFENNFQTLETKIDNQTYLLSATIVNEQIIILLSDISYIKQVSEMKREFFQNASHELKSPLTSIVGYQQMIQEGIISEPKEIKEATLKTIKEANRMNTIIIEMLELSKLESDVAHTLVDVNLASVISEVLSTQNSKIKDKNIAVELDIKDSVVNSTYEHIYALINNLVENAIKYNKINGSIVIKLSNNKLEIKDTGIGIDKMDLNRIFERFYRVDKAKSKELGGTGLGLAIVKHICGIYNYKINV